LKDIVDVLIPAFNEENSIGHVIREIPDFVREIVVVNNRSTDKTEEVATKAGATVLYQPAMGYGNACLMGMDHIAQKSQPPNIVVFLDGDYSDYPEEMVGLIKPIQQGKVDMVIGSRALGNKEAGSMMPQQIFGNWLATSLIRLFYGAKYSDLGPQIKAVKNNFTFAEVPVNYRKRIGTSKVSGTVKGTIMAGYKIITSIFKYL